jgi:hypothetical protein
MLEITEYFSELRECVKEQKVLRKYKNKSKNFN